MDTLSCEISGLSAATEYVVRVAARNAVGLSGFSVEANASTLASLVPRITEFGPQSASAHELSISWEIETCSATGYELQLRKSGTDAWGHDMKASHSDTLAQTFTKLKSTSTYEARVRATGPAGNSAWSELAAAETHMSMSDKLHEVKVKLDEVIGDSCPDVELDVENMKIILHDMINFKGGKAVILAEDMPVQMQLEKTIVALFNIVTEKGFRMFHLRFDGHVHPTGKEMKCLVISYFRAAELARRVVHAGCPSEFLHSYGYGQSRPVTSDKKKADQNRRVEINFLDHHDIKKVDKDACQLWSKIRTSPEFVKFTEDHSCYGEEDVIESMESYAPHGANPI